MATAYDKFFNKFFNKIQDMSKVTYYTVGIWRKKTAKFVHSNFQYF